MRSRKAIRMGQRPSDSVQLHKRLYGFHRPRLDYRSGKQGYHGWDTIKLTATKLTYVLLKSSYLNMKKVVVDGEEMRWSHGKEIGTKGEGLTIESKDNLEKGQVCLDTC